MNKKTSFNQSFQLCLLASFMAAFNAGEASSSVKFAEAVHSETAPKAAFYKLSHSSASLSPEATRNTQFQVQIRNDDGELRRTIARTELQPGDTFEYNVFVGFLKSDEHVVAFAEPKEELSAKFNLTQSEAIPMVRMKDAYEGSSAETPLGVWQFQANLSDSNSEATTIDTSSTARGLTIEYTSNSSQTPLLAQYKVPQSGFYALNNAWAQISSHTQTRIPATISAGKSMTEVLTTTLEGSQQSLNTELGYLTKGDMIQIAFMTPAELTTQIELDATLVEWAPRSAPLRTHRGKDGFLGVYEPSSPIDRITIPEDRWIHVEPHSDDSTAALRTALKEAAVLSSNGQYAGVRLQANGHYILNGDKVDEILFDLSGASNVIFDGNGATLEVSGHSLAKKRIIFFELKDAQSIAFTDMEIKATVKNSTFGEILKVSPMHNGQQTVTFLVSPEQPSPMELIPNGNTAGYAYDAEVPGRISIGTWPTYPGAKAPNLRATDTPQVFEHSVVRTNNSIPSGDSDSPGKWLVKQKKHGIEILRARAGCSDITLQNVSSGRGAIRAAVRYWGADRVNILNCNFSTPEDQWISMSADGFHGRASEALWVENTLISGVCEDISNIYGTTIGVREYQQEPSPKLKIGTLNRDRGAPKGFYLGSHDAAFAEIGDRLVFLDPVIGKVLGRATVIAVSADNSFILDEPISGIQAWDDQKGVSNITVYNDSSVNGFFVRDSTLANSMRFGLFLKAHNTVVFHTLFEGLSGPAIFAANEPRYPEGPVPTHIWLQDNTFRQNANSYDCRNRAHLTIDPAQISIHTGVTAEGFGVGEARTESLENNHLRIIGNRFEDWRGMGIAIRNARNVEISGNTFGQPVEDGVMRETMQKDPLLKGRFSAIFLESVSGVYLGENTYDLPSKDLTITLEDNVRYVEVND